MRIELSEAKRGDLRLMVGTPMYGGMASGHYTLSLCELTKACVGLGIELVTFFLPNESLVQRARNLIVDAFLRSRCTHLLFVDADIGFDAEDALSLLALAGAEFPHDVIAGTYPMKGIEWERVRAAALAGKGDSDANALESCGSRFAFNPLPVQTHAVAADQPVEVREIGAGFMMIRRETFQRLAGHDPAAHYLGDHADGPRRIGLYFDCAVEPDTRRYLSEDYGFCRKVRDAGGQIWLCPWMKLRHVGSYVFSGSLMSKMRS